MYGEAISDENSGNGSLLNRVKATFLTRAADLAWRAVQAINTRLPEGELPQSQMGSRKDCQEPGTVRSSSGLSQRDRFSLSALRSRNSRREIVEGQRISMWC